MYFPLSPPSQQLTRPSFVRQLLLLLLAFLWNVFLFVIVCLKNYFIDFRRLKLSFQNFPVACTRTRRSTFSFLSYQNLFGVYWSFQMSGKHAYVPDFILRGYGCRWHHQMTWENFRASFGKASEANLYCMERLRTYIRKMPGLLILNPFQLLFEDQVLDFNYPSIANCKNWTILVRTGDGAPLQCG